MISHLGSKIPSQFTVLKFDMEQFSFQKLNSLEVGEEYWMKMGLQLWRTYVTVLTSVAIRKMLEYR